MEPMVVALSVLVVIGAFILGVTVSWLAKGYVEDYVENTAYARAVIHPAKKMITTLNSMMMRINYAS